MPFCNKCGKQIFEGHHSCPRCGEIFNSKISEKSPAKDMIKWLIARIWAVVEGCVYFWLGPKFMISLNEKFGLPILKSQNTKMIGAFMICAGVVIFFYCWSLFKILGEGTTQPLDPPRRFVIKGLYRYTRNPIYVGWVIALLGVFLYFGHILLLIYAMLNGVALHLYVLLREEPVLRKRFGKEYIRYTINPAKKYVPFSAFYAMKSAWKKLMQENSVLMLNNRFAIKSFDSENKVESIAKSVPLPVSIVPPV